MSALALSYEWGALKPSIKKKAYGLPASQLSMLNFNTNHSHGSKPLQSCLNVACKVNCPDY
jgi:hypothetical protein